MTDKMRVEFEAFVRSKYGYTGVLTKDGYYRSSAINKLWNCWAESRASLCVELPRKYSTDSIGIAYCADAVIESLEVSGVPYK